MISFAGGAAYFNDCDLHALCAAQETSLFVYHLGAIKERIAAVRHAFGDALELLYAVKVNPLFRLLEALRGEVDGLDIASAGELERALEAGYQPSELSFTGPAKSARSIERALQVGIGAFCAESCEELATIAVHARARGCSARVRLRIDWWADFVPPSIAWRTMCCCHIRAREIAWPLARQGPTVRARALNPFWTTHRRAS